MKKYKLLITTLALALTGCESITDTFKDYAGDGEIRYVGKCDDLTVSPGWERLEIKWTNTNDPIIDKVKVKWFTDDTADSVLLDRGTTEYNIKGLTDATYGITVSSLDKDGDESLTNTIYGRPYTTNHEVIQSFTRVISKYYYIGDRLALYFIGWQEGLDKVTLKYTTKGGEDKELAITQNMIDSYWGQKQMLLEDPIDTSKPVTLYRTGKVSGCSDEINFAPFELEKTKTYSADFKEYLKKLYGDDGTVLTTGGTVNEDWVKKTTTLELDGDFSSFDDILNFPNLKKLILGKHRYLTELGAKDQDKGQSKVTDGESSIFAINTLNKLTGLTVDRYNNHYKELDDAGYWDWDGKPSYLTEKGMPTIPVTHFIDLSKAKIEVSPEDEQGYDSKIGNLVDNDPSSCWLPLAQAASTDYTFDIDLGSEKLVKGLKLVQKAFTSKDQDQDLAPTQLKIEAIGKSGGYEPATYIETSYLGSSSGETNLIPFKDGGIKTRNIRITIPAQAYHGFYQLTIAELGLY